MAGLFLNSYPLSCSGSVRLFRLRGDLRGRRRRELQDELGVAVRVEGGQPFTYEQPAADAEPVDRSLSPTDALAMFAIRAALVEHCRRLGFDAGIVRAGELRVAGILSPDTEDLFRIEHVMHLRVGREDFIAADAILTVRHRTAWRCTAPLSDPGVAAQAQGEFAVRLTGDGPRRGRVIRIDGAAAVLQSGSDDVEVATADYTLAANAALIARWRGSAVLRKVRVTAGDLTISGRRNQHAIEDRFKLVGNAVRTLGTEFAVGDAGTVTIASRPVQIRLESRP